MIDFDFLFGPVEHLDETITTLFQGAPLVVALGVAFLLGVRHATDPDHLMAVTALVARDQPHDHDRPLRTPREAFGIGLLHGLAGTGAVVLLLIAALPNALEASAALAVFAPMSAVSMALCTSGFAWTLSRPAVLPVYRTVLMPALGAMGLLFGLWYVGLA